MGGEGEEGKYLGVCGLAQDVSEVGIDSRQKVVEMGSCERRNVLERRDQYQLDEVERRGVRELVRRTDHTYCLVGEIGEVFRRGVLHDL